MSLGLLLRVLVKICRIEWRGQNGCIGNRRNPLGEGPFLQYWFWIRNDWINHMRRSWWSGENSIFGREEGLVVSEDQSNEWGKIERTVKHAFHSYSNSIIKHSFQSEKQTVAIRIHVTKDSLLSGWVCEGVLVKMLCPQSDEAGFSMPFFSINQTNYHDSKKHSTGSSNTIISCRFYAWNHKKSSEYTR
jgi:hypothetical protein